MLTNSLDECAYSIFNTVRPHIKDDDVIDIRMIKDYIHTYRTKYIKQQLDKNNEIDPSLIQNLGSVEMELVDSSEDSSLETGYNMLRTTSEIPQTISSNSDKYKAYTRIAPADKLSKQFTLIDHEQSIYTGNLRFNDHQIFAFWLDNKIYLKAKYESSWKGIKYINIQGVFQNPVDVWRFTDPSTYKTFDSTVNYPISKNIRSIIEKEIMRDKFGILLDAPIDIRNNASHELNTQIDEEIQ